MPDPSRTLKESMINSKLFNSPPKDIEESPWEKFVLGKDPDNNKQLNQIENKLDKILSILRRDMFYNLKTKEWERQ